MTRKVVTEYPRRPAFLIVVPAADHLLDGGPQEDRVFKLRRVAALDVDQGRVGLDDAGVHEVVQPEQVLFLDRKSVV